MITTRSLSLPVLTVSKPDIRLLRQSQAAPQEHNDGKGTDELRQLRQRRSLISAQGWSAAPQEHNDGKGTDELRHYAKGVR